MSIYKEASRSGLRIQTSFGLLSVEQLWSMKIQDLDKIAVALEEKIEKSSKKSFLVKRSEADKELKLQFDIVKDILDTLVEEQEKILAEAENRKHNAKIDRLIAAKQDKDMENMSVEELEKLRK